VCYQFNLTCSLCAVDRNAPNKQHQVLSIGPLGVVSCVFASSFPSHRDLRLSEATQTTRVQGKSWSADNIRRVKSGRVRLNVFPKTADARKHRSGGTGLLGAFTGRGFALDVVQR
jgi:hypothetical protein